MNLELKKFVYRTVFLLDRIPRYGRLYELNLEAQAAEDIRGPVRWAWMKDGSWGSNLLGNRIWEAYDLLSPESDTEELAPVPESNTKR